MKRRYLLDDVACSMLVVSFCAAVFVPGWEIELVHALAVVGVMCAWIQRTWT